MLPTTHKCVLYWPVSHAIVTCYPLNGFHHKPPLCKGRWHFRKKMTEGLLLTSLSSFCSLRSISQSLSLAFARQLPLHKGAFDTIKFFSCFLFAFSSSAEPLLNHVTIAWFSLYKKDPIAFAVGSLILKRILCLVILVLVAELLGAMLHLT